MIEVVTPLSIDHGNIPAEDLAMARENAARDPDGQEYPWRRGYPQAGATVYYEGKLWTVGRKEFGPGEDEPIAMVQLVGVGRDELAVATRDELRPVTWTAADEHRHVLAGVMPKTFTQDDGE